MVSLVRSFVKSAVALCVLCAVAFAQSKPKAAVYIMGNPEGRDALRSAVNTFLVKSGKYQMIAVDAIDVVAQEQRRQLSGSVSDGDIAALGRDAGAQYVCVVQRSELDGVSYVATRMVSVQSKVAELADIVELPPGGKVIDIIQWQIGSMLGMPVGPRPTGSGSGYAARPAQSTYAAPSQTSAASAGRSDPSVRGTVVPGGSLAQKLVWLQKSADSHETYIIEVTADESIAPGNTFEYNSAIDITIVMRGVGGNRTIRLQSHGTMFIVKKEITFIIDNNITLRGHNGNNSRMVDVYGGVFRMNAGVTITGNINSAYGGGVHVGGGTFEMNGGTIVGNTSNYGGGVHVDGGTFIMTGGTIVGNTATNAGGGVEFYNGVFTMRGGVIANNTARERGGGVYASSNFTKTGGSITGYKNDPANGNVVKDEDDTVLSRKGHAIYRSDSQRKETTAGPSNNFAKDGSGSWDQ
ncbi:hypothetical protein R80B4_00833 [Fibrobacteres bacterium R8-0-B4]